jgi:hypothetical protein
MNRKAKPLPDPASLGTFDGKAARERLAKRGQIFTAIGAATASGNAFHKRLEDKELQIADIGAYGVAFINAALGVD